MRPIGNSPLETTTLRLEQNKSFSFGIQILEEGHTPIDISDCKVRFATKAFQREATHTTLGTVRIDLQAEDLQTPGSFAYVVTLVTSGGYSSVVMKGTIDVLHNADLTLDEYSALTPPQNVEVRMRGTQVVQVAAAPQLPPAMTAARAARVDSRGHLILTMEDGNELDVGKVVGDPGPEGPPGGSAQTLYTWIKYADTPVTGMSNNPEGKAFRGVAYNKTSPIESTNYADYTWERIQGPPGAPGVDGAPGIPGSDGQDGTQLYTWLKYADTPTSGMSEDPEGKTYIGLAYNQSNPVESNDYADYRWSKILGEDGAPGLPGADGQPRYTWIKYATGPSGEGMSDSSTGMVYIGLAFNKESQVESSNPADYQWSLFRGTSLATITPFYQAKAQGQAAPALPTTMTPPAAWTTTEPEFQLRWNLYRTERIVYDNGTFAYTPVSLVTGNFGASYVAGMVEASTHVGPNAPTGEGSPFEGQMWWVTNASNNFAGLQRYNGTLWQNYRIMADSVIAAKSVSAPLLEADLVLASKIQAGASADSHTYMAPTGLHFMSKIGSAAPVELLRINMPSGSEEESGNVFSLRKADDLDSSVMSISEAGVGSFASLSSAGMFETSEFKLAGKTLEEVLDPRPLGAVVYGSNSVRGKTVNSGNTGSSATGFQLALGEIRFSAEAGRVYRVSSSPVAFYIPQGVRTWLRARYTTDGSQPDLDSATLAGNSMPTVRPYGSVSSEMLSLSYEFEHMPSFDQDVRILFTIEGYGTANDNGALTAYDSGTNVLQVFVQDLGRREVAGDAMVDRTNRKHGGSSATGGSDTAPPAAKKDYTYTGDCTSIRTYNVSGGAYNSYYANKAVTGSYNGSSSNNYRGFLYFGSLLSTLSGADIVSVEAYVYMSHWYWGAGGSARVGYLTNSSASAPATLTTDGSGLTGYSTAKPGGAWVKLPSACHSAIKDGTFRAFVISSASLSKDYYGYATSGKIRVQYKK